MLLRNELNFTRRAFEVPISEVPGLKSPGLQVAVFRVTVSVIDYT